jgi:hypothetical protein
MCETVFCVSMLVSNMKYLINIICFLLWNLSMAAQDTVFIQKHSFEEGVNNVDGDGKNVIVRTEKHLYLLGIEGFQEIRGVNLSGGRYTWISVDKQSVFSTINTQYIVPEHEVGESVIVNMLPGSYHPNITKGSSGEKLFIAYRGNVLEYEVRSFYKVEHRGASVRGVYNDDTIKITSTYSGIYTDTFHLAFSEKLMPGGDYSNGEVAKINDKYYLCKDDIMVMENNSWRRVTKLQSPPFRKLKEHKGKVYFLSEQMVGLIDLEKGIIIDTLLHEHGNLYDIKWIDDQLVVASEDGNLYLLNTDGEPQKVFVGSCVYDINVNANGAILSCRDGIYRFDMNGKKIDKLFKLNEAVQSLSINKELLITTYNGLYVLHDEKLYNILSNVEFNKLGLSKWEDYIFAGSIQGLYVLNIAKLLLEVIPSLTPIEIKVQTPSTYVYVLLNFLVVIFAILYFNIRKRQKKLMLEINRKTKVTPEAIRAAMLENDYLISVESVAEHFSTSTVQINRILKKHNTSGLKLLKDVKGEIVMAMVENKASIEQISVRVGYSIAYLKRNYLRLLD